MAVVRAAPRRVLLSAWLVSLYSVLAAGDDPAASLLSQVRFKQWHCLSAQCRSLEAALECQHAPSHTQCLIPICWVHAGWDERQRFQRPGTASRHLPGHTLGRADATPGVPQALLGTPARCLLRPTL